MFTEELNLSTLKKMLKLFLDKTDIVLTSKLEIYRPRFKLWVQAGCSSWWCYGDVNAFTLASSILVNLLLFIIQLLLRLTGHRRHLLSILPNGMLLHYHIDDLNIIREVWWEGCYDVFSMKEIKNRILVLDCGAHIGTYMLKIANLAHKLIAFEPEPRNQIFLRLNYLVNNLDAKATLIPACVYNKEGKVKLFLGTKSFTHTLKEEFHEATNKYIEVPAVTIDSLNLKIDEVDTLIIKIDVEGAEAEVLEGAYQTLERMLAERKKVIILAEIQHTPSEQKVVMNYLLQKFGFTVKLYKLHRKLKYLVAVSRDDR